MCYGNAVTKVYPLYFLKPVVDISSLVLSKGSYSAAVHVRGVWMDIVCVCVSGGGEDINCPDFVWVAFRIWEAGRKYNLYMSSICFIL